MQLSDSHKKRIVSGLLMAAALAACLVMGGWPLRVMICLVSVLALWEFYQMFWPGFLNILDKTVGYAAALALCLLGALETGSSFSSWTLIILGFVAFYAAFGFLVSYGGGNDQARLSGQALLLFGIMYIPLSMQLALHISLAEQFVVLLAAIGSDTGAYYAGTALGKRKIWPRVSPKKSWEGAVGGLCASMVILAVYSHFVSIPMLEHLSFWQWGLMGIVLSVFAQAGDFFESALKRSVGVKDSSNLIPGHGGILDRLDSIIFALPVYMFIRMLCLAG